MRFKRCLALVLAMVLLAGAMPALAEYNMPYYVEVDLTNQLVTVFKTRDGSIARQMLCSAGLNDKTPTGVWYMPTKERSDERTEWYYMPNAYTWVKWPTKIYYAYFFHSIPFDKKDDSRMNETCAAEFGRPASHGCIRLRVEDAYWIAKNCLAGTRVRIYKSGDKDEELRSLLYVSSYLGDEGDISYSEFLGISENDLGRGCTGSEVVDLQHRLNDLGYYDGGFDGVYNTDVITAVKQVQKDLGLSQSGISTKELLAVLYSDSAPVSKGNIDLAETQSGPVVKQLQSALAELGVYAGPLDSVYDVEVADAVRTVQTMCGMTADGKATKETQHAVYYVLDKVKKAMGEEEFTLSYANEEVTTAIIKSPKANILVRSKASTSSDSTGKLADGDQVIVLATQGDWARIVVDNKIGYIYKKYLSSPGKTENIIVNFTSASGKTFTLGTTMEERFSGGAASLADEIRSYYNNADFMDYLKEATVSYATVDTGSDDVKLNLRESPSSDANVLMQVDNGMSMRVLERDDDWTKVVYNGNIGYLMSQYLSFWQGTSEDESEVLSMQNMNMDAENALDGEVVTEGENERAPIYASPSTEASILARAPKGLKLKVLSFNETTGWIFIDYNGNQGYMRDENVSFSLGPTDGNAEE